MAKEKHYSHSHSSRHNYFPWLCCNDVVFLIDGVQFFPEMLKAIEQSKSFILMEIYLFESGKVADRFIKAFSDAALRGVTVLLTIDAYGSLKLSKADREKLLRSGVYFIEYNPLRLQKWFKNFFRTHRKILIIDGTTAFTGGFGLTDDFDGKDGWRDTAIKITGVVNKEWMELFKNNFTKWTKHPVPQALEKYDKTGNTYGRVAYTNSGHHLEIKKHLLNRIYNSRRNIWLASAYFVPSRKVRKLLRKAASRGRDVRLLLPGPVTDHPAVRYASQHYYAKLLRNGVRIFEYQERFSHTKMVLIDNWFSIGSANMDRWNFRWNLEANQELKKSPELIKEAKSILLNDFSQSKEISYEKWKNRSKSQRFIEWFWSRVNYIITGHQ